MPHAHCRRASTLAAAVAAAILAALPAAAEPDDLRFRAGEREYRDGCAVCHGMQGTGNGAIAALLTVPPPDLTALAAGNGGDFPFGRVYRVIDGRAPVAGHGSSEMPVWGKLYREDALDAAARDPYSPDPELMLAGRILVLMHYLMEIQEE